VGPSRVAESYGRPSMNKVEQLQCLASHASGFWAGFAASDAAWVKWAGGRLWARSLLLETLDAEWSGFSRDTRSLNEKA
jgi:hypothetical protein